MIGFRRVGVGGWRGGGWEGVSSPGEGGGRSTEGSVWCPLSRGHLVWLGRKSELGRWNNQAGQLEEGFQCQLKGGTGGGWW